MKLFSPVKTFFGGKAGAVACCGAYWLALHLGQVSGGGPLRIDQPQTVQIETVGIDKKRGPEAGPFSLELSELTT